MPNKSAEETEKYANSPDITIIANTPKQQAVKDHSANLWIGNFHEKGRLGQVEAMTRGAIMVKNKDGGLELTFSDPMREQSQLVFTLHGYTGITVSDSNPAISISEDSSGQSVTFTINTAAKDGRSYYLKVNYMNSLSELCPIRLP
ncbi:polysaccharide lyase beta-sandwich domain-containing protein, partial [Paenibacillus larvae]|nr:polysaccharide lyase beta-sandwich domain-containing protein [Paenibacillus larvae]